MLRQGRDRQVIHAQGAVEPLPQLTRAALSASMTAQSLLRFALLPPQTGRFKLEGDPVVGSAVRFIVRCMMTESETRYGDRNCEMV